MPPLSLLTGIAEVLMLTPLKATGPKSYVAVGSSTLTALDKVTDSATSSDVNAHARADSPTDSANANSPAIFVFMCFLPVSVRAFPTRARVLGECRGSQTNLPDSLGRRLGRKIRTNFATRIITNGVK